MIYHNQIPSFGINMSGVSVTETETAITVSGSAIVAGTEYNLAGEFTKTPDLSISLSESGELITSGRAWAGLTWMEADGLHVIRHAPPEPADE